MTKLLLLLFTSLKFGKLLTTGGTMLLSIVVYASLYGWKFAIGFVALLLIHEMGHYIAARQRGLNVGAPTFIPFMGAWIALKDLPHDAETEAYIGLGGPLAGTIGAACCYFLARDQHSNLLLAVAYSGFFLNLFNLIPLSPLDGGRICAAISHRLWLLGIPILVATFVYKPSPVLFLIALLALPGLWQTFTRPHSPEQQQYYAVPFETRLQYGLLYVGLTLYLAIMAYDVHNMLN